jgi:hypothetical protein
MHYGIETVKGSHFRRVTLADPARHGLLGKGAILMMTAYPNRTSPVLRGAWISIACSGRRRPTRRSTCRRCRRIGADSRRRRCGPARTAPRQPDCFACHGVMDPLGPGARELQRGGAVPRQRSRTR